MQRAIHANVCKTISKENRNINEPSKLRRKEKAMR